MTLLEQCQKWHENGEYKKIIETLEEMPPEQRTPEMDSELARAYNNLATFDESYSRPMYKKAISLLKPHAGYFSGNHYWNFRMGYAYYYLEQEGVALRYFEEALKDLPGDEDTLRFIKYCNNRIALPKFKKPFSMRVEEAWKAFQKEEAQLRHILDTDEDHRLGGELVAKCDEIFKLAFDHISFELGLSRNKYELTLTPEGDKVKLFELVYFQKHAPADILDKWNIQVGRRPMKDVGLHTDIQGEEYSLTGEDVLVWIDEKDSNGVNLTLYCEKILPLLKTARAAETAEIAHAPEIAGAAKASEADEIVEVTEVAEAAEVAKISEGDEGAKAAEGDEVADGDEGAKAADVAEVAEVAEVVETAEVAEEKAFWLLYTLTDITLGDIAGMYYINSIFIAESPKDEPSFTLTELPQMLEDMGMPPSPDAQTYLDNYIPYQINPIDDGNSDWRMDIIAGSTCCPPFINEYFDNESYSVDRLHADGAVAGFFCYPLDGFSGENRRAKIFAFRDLLEEALMKQAGEDAISLLGGATGVFCGYIDFIAWDLQKVLIAAKEIFENSGLPWADFHTFRHDTNAVCVLSRGNNEMN